MDGKNEVKMNWNEIEKHRGELIKMGRRIPAQLINILQEKLLESAMTWLKQNGAPDEVVQAIETADYLRLMAGDIDGGTLSDLNAADLPETIIEAADLAVKFGGCFCEWDCGESKIPTWEGAKQKEEAPYNENAL